ncbi:outer membrane protein assembly factor BamD [Helicobacter mustelae]|uniref:Putative lipoprotein n=1 Tax=Helicobacter mustelae (strain ATCC 43772 / CCUG 25715 / CIP 103759 / LMG 18044 / NCTC 12198 / R85-136P) TaxID=679897 RepID=D3UGD6_HELM1|nr:outer membrane protein assembly factor BamD [Helicobacter mustelae]CBG39557.1 putative lipoprotein [Helicobacter mustelae 12198]SQH71069.1 lipoprotein [Helicobacter mustelae]STP12198.1 lipoprotein [Helicobacter mustelae]
MRIIFVIYATAFLVFLGCSSKKEKNEFNKPAMYWYQEMLKEIKSGSLENADNHFSSLQSEHINSPLLPDAMLILGKAHQVEKEFVLADYYFDEYLKRYATADNVDYITYLKIQTHYLAFVNYSKDQQFLENAVIEIQNFLDKFPDSRYLDLIKTMQLRLLLGRNELNRAIANVYAKQKKPNAQKAYLDRIEQEIEDATKPTPSYVPWYVRLFNW